MMNLENNLISFSLWGANPKYTIGAIKNAELAPDIYPGWICRFYVGDDVPREIIKRLEGFAYELVYMKTQSFRSALWRFYAALDPNAELILFRDTDSRLNNREKMAVRAWSASGKSFHIMRDHACHGARMLGGMWGIRNGVIPDMKELIEEYLITRDTNTYGIDQEFLKNVIFPLAKHDALIHDSRSSDHPWPVARERGEYVGAPFDAEDRLLIKHR